MVRLKSKPTECKGCPFCYTEKRYVHGSSGIEEREHSYCGVGRRVAEFDSCPLE